MNKEIEKKQARNIDIIERSQYNYLYTDNSGVFHRRSCKIMLSANKISGSVNYSTAAKKRRPCKICNPVDENASIVEIDEIIRVKLLGDKWIDIREKKIVGCCHNIIHPGKLTMDLLKEHDCIAKECTFFEKYEDASYWLMLEEKKKKKAIIKEKVRIEKAKRAELEKNLESMRSRLQDEANQAGYKMLITKLEKVSKRTVKIFYVSENKVMDWEMFPKIYDEARVLYPQYSFLLWHVRGVDRKFLTIDEYKSIKR